MRMRQGTFESIITYKERFNAALKGYDEQKNPKMENKNSKIENFFSEQLKEIKEYHCKVWGKVYTERTRDGAIERCLELADFDVCLEDIEESLRDVFLGQYLTNEIFVILL
jgi:hypothetical protein